MKIKVCHLLTSFAAAFLISFSLYAQEGLPPVETPDPQHRELNLDEDKTLIYEQPSHTSVARDTVMLVPRATTVPQNKNPKPDNSKTSRGEEDALSFNFLYYMIQKFKLSDLIDQ